MKRITAALLIAALILFLFLACGDSSSSSDDNDDDNNTTDDDTSDDDSSDDDIDDDDNDDNDTTDDDTPDDDTIDDDTIDDDSIDDDTGGDWDPPFAPEPSDEIGIFVSAAIGSDDNPGTMQSPVHTVAYGLELAAAAGKVVFVAKGTYNESVTPGVSLFGGYRASDWARNMPTYITTIETADRAAVTITCQKAQVIVEGFTLLGATVEGESWAVEIAGGDAIVAHNIIRGDSMFQYGEAISYGLYIHEQSTVEVIRNIIGGGDVFSGDPTVVSAGAIIHNSEAYLFNNIITSGQAFGYGSASRGVQVLYLSNVVLANNLIQTQQTLGSTVSLLVGGSALATAVNNTIIAAEGRWSGSIGVYVEGQALLANNAVRCSGNRLTCSALDVAEAYGTMISMYNNDLWGIGEFHPLTQFPDYFDDLEEINACEWYGCIAAADNISADPLFVGGGDLHLTAGSPCIDAGLDPSPWYEVEIDFDGDARPLGDGWDIGADEYTP